MRRIVLIATALGVLVAAGTAYAAINTYSASLAFTSKKAGTAAKPVPMGYNLDIKAMGTNGNRTAVLNYINTKIYGIKADGKDFPTCSASRIAAAQNDSKCPKGALVAKGAITAVLGSATNFTASASACDPALDVWNGGQGKLVFFFVDTPTHPCLGGALHTGQVGPYPATYKQQGKYLLVNVPIPSFVNYPLGPGNLAGSLTGEHLAWRPSTAKLKNGKTVYSIASVACQGKKRPYTITFNATLPTTGQSETVSVSKSGAC